MRVISPKMANNIMAFLDRVPMKGHKEAGAMVEITDVLTAIAAQETEPRPSTFKDLEEDNEQSEDAEG